MPWLVHGDEVVASAEVAVTRRLRRRGLIGRDHMEGVLVLRPCRMVHTFGVEFPIDVAFCDREGFVLRTTCMPRRRLSRLVWRSAFVIEARAGSLERWKLRPGDVVEIKG